MSLFIKATDKIMKQYGKYMIRLVVDILNEALGGKATLMQCEKRARKVS
jgi:hypothetical protein